MKLSMFCHVFSRDGVVGLYNATNHDLRFLDESVWHDVEVAINGSSVESSSQVVVELKNAGYLVSDEQEDDYLLSELQKRYKTPGINMLYLLLVEGCNLSCRYCFFEKGFDSSPPLNPMSWSIAKEAIDFYAGLLDRLDSKTLDQRQKIVNFYGGEPLLNREIFERSVLYVGKLIGMGRLPDDVRLAINTNGTVMDHDLAMFIMENDVEVGVSIDGPQTVHDHNRKTIGGQGTFQQAISTFKMLRDLGVNVGVSCTVSEGISQKMPDIFRWLVDELGVRSMGFNPLIECAGFKVMGKTYAEDVSTGLIECYKIARDKDVHEDRVMRKVKPFVEGYFYDRDCSATGRQIVFGPNGTVGICPTYYSSGRYFVNFTPELDPLEHPIWTEWIRRIPINMPQCLNCEALGVCGGGCPFNASVRTGSIWEVDSAFCVHSKEMLKWLVWDLYDIMNAQG